MTLDLQDLRMFTDAVRWWGALGAVFTLHDFGHRASSWLRGKPHPPVLSVWLDAWAKALVCSFVLGAGAAIPFFHDTDSPLLTIHMALMWPQASIAVWLYTASRSLKPKAMIAVGVGAFAIMLIASCATVARYG